MSINEDSEPVDIKPGATDFEAHDADVYRSARQWKAQGLRITELTEADTFPRWMREARHWCVSSPDKVPKSLSGPEPVNSDQPELARDTWVTLAEACAAAKQRGPGWSPGFVVDNNFGALDLDNCRCPRTGLLVSWAADCDTVAREIGAHIRPSMSGCGLHIWGALPRRFIGDKSTIEIGSGKAETWIKPASRHIKAGARVAFAGSAEAQNLEPIIELLEAHAGLSVEAQQPTREQSVPQEGAEELPGDAFNRLADCSALLAAHGWQLLYERGGASFWRRPGKTEGPRSASLGYLRGTDGMPLFWCHSRDAAPIKAERAYSPFGLLAALEHGNDCSAAARALRPEVTATLKVRNASGKPEAAGAIVSPESWPKPIAAIGFAGPIGAFALRVSQKSEADVNAVYVQALIAFGNLLGRRARFRVGASIHTTNQYALVVGSTGSGRKGLGGGVACALYEHEEDRLMEPLRLRMPQGLTTGQGLIHSVRDASEAPSPAPTNDRSGEKAPRPDPGVSDKRLLVIEHEFSRVLAQLKNKESTLSATLRDFWDKGSAELLNKTSPIKATGAAISMIGHITPQELRSASTETDVFNGFLNRFLFICSRRPRLISRPEAIRGRDFEDLRAQLREALRFFETWHCEIEFSVAAEGLWDELYHELESERAGKAEALLARAAPHCLRLAMIIAASQGAATIGTRDLQAARAIWRYCEDSVYHIFGRSTGCKNADRIRSALIEAPNGLTRTEINRQLFRGNVEATRLTAALALLEAQGLAMKRITSTQGGPEERWSKL